MSARGGNGRAAAKEEDRRRCPGRMFKRLMFSATLLQHQPTVRTLFYHANSAPTRLPTPLCWNPAPTPAFITMFGLIL